MTVEHLTDKERGQSRTAGLIIKLVGRLRKARLDLVERFNPPQVLEGTVLSIDPEPAKYPGMYAVHLLMENPEDKLPIVVIPIHPSAVGQYRIGEESIYATISRLLNKPVTLRVGGVSERHRLEVERSQPDGHKRDKSPKL